METETQTTSTEVEAVEQIVKTGNGNSDLLQEREKIRQLEIELERMEKVLQSSETHNRQLKMELSLAEQKLEERGEICKEFELNKKNLQEEIREAEKKYICRIDVLQQELNEQELKNKELATVKETFDRTSVELEKYLKKVQDLERELQGSLSEARMFENLSNENRLHAEKEEQKTKNLEKSIELLKMNANKTESEIEILKEELEKSKSLVHEMEKKLHLYQASEEQTKKDITEMEGLLSLTKQELQFKVNMIEETQLKLTEEEKRKEMEVSRLQKEYDMLSQEKKALETSLAETNNNLFQVKDKCADLTEKLSLSEDKFNKTDSLLSQALSNSCNLEIKLKSLEEQQKEFAEVVERNAKLQNMVEELNTSVRDTGLLLKEAEDIFVSSELKNEELERMLNIAESNVVETEKKLKREGLEFHNRISQMELNLNQKDSRNSELELELKKLKEGIHVITENKTELEGALNSSNAKLVTSETLLNDLTHQLRETKENLEKTCLDLETSRINEKKTTEKLRILDIQLEEQKTQVQQASARYSDLELKLHDELEKFMQKENDLQNQLEEARKKLEKVYLDLEASGINEKETMKKLGILDMQLQEQKAQVQRASARNSELELKLKDELDKFIKKENDLQNQLEKGKERLEKAYLDLEASRINEKETTKKLGILHIQLEEQRNQFQQASARNSELELKLKDELDKFMQKENDLQNQLGEAKEKLEKTCLDLETSRGNENETMKKREILDIQLEEQRTQLQQASARHSELELKLKDELDKFMQKENDLQNQLGETKGKLEKTCLDLETSRGSHNETMKKREILDIQLEEQRTQLQKVSASHSELELKLKDELDKFMQKENDLQNRLGEAKEKLDKTCLDFEALRINENETVKKLGILDIQLEEQRTQLQEASARNSELELKLKNELNKFMQKENDLQNQLGEAKEKLEKTCIDLEASGINEKEIMKKLGILDTQLQEQRAQLQQATARNSELELKLKDELDKFMQRENDLQNQLGETKGKLEKTCLDLETSRGSHNETMKKREILEIQLEEASSRHSELELKHKDARDKFIQQAEETKVLHDKIFSLENQANVESGKFSSLKEALEERAKKLAELEYINDKLVKDLSEANARAEGSNLECELLTATNTKIMEEISVHELKNKELEGLLISVEREKKDISEQIIELSNEKSRVFETQQHELEESCLKLKNLEIILEEKKLKIDHLEQENRDLSKSNSNLTQKHLTEENKINELSTVLNKMIMEKNNLQERLHSSEVLVKNMEESEKKAIEEKESNVREIEEKLFLAQKENNDLKQELNLAQIKFSETDKERKSFYDKASELSILFKNLEAESKNKISKLESDLNNSYSKNAELEAELKLDAERCIELESKVGLAEQHMIELEDVLKVSNKNIIELNEQLNTTAVERKAIESSSNISREKLLESQNLIHKLSNELTSTQEKLEVAEKEIESFADRETKIKERLKFSEELIDNSGKMREEATKRSLEPEILCESQATISETKLKDANTQFFEKDAENKDLLQNLMALEDQLKIFLEKDTEESQRSLTLNAELDESLRKIKTLEKRIDELQVNLSEEEDKSKLVRENNLLLDMKIKEVQDLLTSTQMEKQATENRLQILEKQAKNYETRSEELDLKLKSVEIHQESGHKLEECESKIAKLDNDMSRSRGLATVESTINALKSQLAEDDDTIRRYSSEKDRLSDENLLQQELNTHRAKINELEEILSRVQNGEVLNPDFTIEPSTQKSSMASHEMTYQNLESKAIALQIKVRQLEEDKIKLDESNLKLSRELEENQANMDQLYSNLNSTLVDKETNGQFPISKVTVETLMHHVASEKEQLKSQISSVGEENIQLRKQLEDIKAELKIAASKKDEKLNEDEEKEDSPDKIPTSTSLSEVVELEQKLLLDESRLKIETQSSKPTIDEEEVKRENTSKRNRHTRTNSLRSSQLKKIKSRSQIWNLRNLARNIARALNKNN